MPVRQTQNTLYRTKIHCIYGYTGFFYPADCSARTQKNKNTVYFAKYTVYFIWLFSKKSSIKNTGKRCIFFQGIFLTKTENEQSTTTNHNRTFGKPKTQNTLYKIIQCIKIIQWIILYSVFF